MRISVVLLALSPISARAEFINDVKKTFQTDIPHFFQDDIPCAFGGQPTSQTKNACKPSGRAAKSAPVKAGDPAATPLHGDAAPVLPEPKRTTN